MNREVEERIVAMYFDNKDFEQNAKQTIETLGQLKEGLNLEDSAKGFKVFDKIKDALNMNKANQGARQLRNTLTGLSNTMSKALNIGEAPVRAMDNLFSTFRGYLTKFIGFDLAGKVVNTVESTLRQLTIAPISAGWTQYESKMDSVKTIMSGTGESIEVVEEHLKNLTDYANKTIYSLSDMTSNLGKFTNNGVKLEEATAAMKGIANATADAGQGAQQASMAMYNISQAIGVGKMTTIDWKSLENANIATQKLKNTFLEVAAAGGRLEKQTDGNGLMHFFLTKDENGQALKEKVELTAANFREYLSKGWLDKETMLKTFQLYSGEGITVDTLKAWGIDNEEDQKRLMQIGQEALEAAQQVRTFSKMMDALKESVQSGWADSFQLIFGNMEEGTTLWTNINERLDKVLSGASDRRNAILKEWAEMDENYASVFKKHGEHGELVKDADGGRDILVKSFFELMDVAMEFGKVVSDSFHKVFGTLDAKGLMNITLGFRNLVNTIKQWFGSMDDAGSRISKISKVLTGIFSVVKVGFNFLKAGFSIVKKIAKPVVDMLLDAFSGIGEFLTGMGDLNIGQFFNKIGEGFSKLWEKIKAIFVPKDMPGGGQELPIVTWIREKWQGLKKAIRDWANDNGLSGIIDAISSFAGTILGWDGWNQIGSFFESGKQMIVDAWEAVKNWPVWRSIGSFLTDTWDWVLKILGLRKDENGDATAGTESITEGISAISDSAQEAAKAREESNRKIRALLGDEPEFGNVDMETPEDGGFSQNILGWLGNAWNTISAFWDNTFHGETAQKVWGEIAGFFTNTWEWIKHAANVTVGFFTQPQEDGDTGFINWVQGIWESIQSFWNDTIVTGGAPVWNAIASFFTDTWNWIANTARTAVKFFTEPDGYTGETGFVTWIRGVWEDISTFWNEEILNRAKPLWEAIAQFCSNTWGWISSQFKQRKYDDRGFELNEAQDAPIVSWLTGIWGSIKGTWNDVVGWEGWQAVGEFLSNTWGWITSLFTGNGIATAGADKDAVAKAEANAGIIEEATKDEGFLDRILSAVGGFFERVMGAINGIIVPKELTEFLTNLGDFLTGILKVINEVLGTIGRLFSGKATEADKFKAIIAAITGIVVTILKFKFTKMLIQMGDMQSFGTQFLEISAGFLLIASALSLLTTIDQDKMLKAAAIMAGMGVVIGIIVALVNRSTKIAQEGKDKQTVSERILTNLVNTIGKLGTIAIALALLPDVIKAIGEAKHAAGDKDIGNDLLNTFLGLSALIGTVSIVGVLVQKISGSQGLDPKVVGKTMISIVEVVGIISAVALAVGGIGEAAEGIFGVGSHEAILGAMEKAADFFKSLGKVVGDFFRGLFGIKSDEEKADEALAIFENIGDSLSAFDMEKISGISRMLTMIQQITDESIKFDSGKMVDFAQSMGELGSGIYEIAGYISEIEGPLSELHNPESIMFRKLEGFTTFGKQLGDMLLTFTNVHIDDVLKRLHILAGEKESEQFVNDLNVILNALGKLNDPGSGIQFDGLTIAKKLFDAIQDGLMDTDMPAFDATSVVDAIVLALTQGDAAIAAIVHDMVQQGIELSGKTEGGGEYELSDDTRDIFEKILSGKITDPSQLIDLSSWEKQLFGEDGAGGLLGDFNSMVDQVPDLESVFAEKFDFKDEAGNQLDILGEFQDMLGTINEELATMEPLKVTITPVFDMTNFTPDKMQEALSSMPVRYTPGTTATHMTIEFRGLKEELGMDAVREKLEQIRAAVALWGLNNVNSTNSLGRNIDGVSNEISRMQLVIDTGALVGYIMPMIDAGLYQRSVTASRTGTVTMM